MSPQEANGRMRVAAASFAEWTTDDLITELVLLADETDTDPFAEDKAQAISLALIFRGYTADQVLQPWTLV